LGSLEVEDNKDVKSGYSISFVSYSCSLSHPLTPEKKNPCIYLSGVILYRRDLKVSTDKNDQLLMPFEE